MNLAPLRFPLLPVFAFACAWALWLSGCASPMSAASPTLAVPAAASTDSAKPSTPASPSPSSPSSAASRSSATFVLLGELHDNPDHHRARAAQLRQWVAQEPRTVVVFEQIGRAQDAAVAQVRRAQPNDLEAALQAAQFDRKAWGWPLHQPLFEAVIQSGAELRGGNLDRDQVRRIVREGDGAWPADLLALRARTPWTEAQQQVLRKDIQEGHCGVMPEAMLPGMVQAQRARDAAMAQAMLTAQAQGAKRVVLIAGNGHVRRDVAVPVYLQAAGVPATDIDAVGYLEAGGPEAAGGYDRVERAVAPPREDPCAAFKR
ncbi:ChaN family lipoprotein [Roseateles amylovorans]|uniref:ChaN family lipoprotein n=1 Tax=Roseateles amylovorans TaxID=2978473 RepID=A0ABY6AXH3_9BURK|nr:ChaN family lipoprotein [Roseateles amylovorans]UXH77587.1 ChaN family lipoprotein [Roseateles amylovorans]